MPDALFQNDDVGTCGYVPMIGEVKCEERLRYDTASISILGLRQEHGDAISLEYCSMDDKEAVIAAVGSGSVYFRPNPSFFILHASRSI